MNASIAWSALVVVVLGLSTTVRADAGGPPQSPDARRAMLDHDRAVRDAELAFEKAKAAARQTRTAALNAALDKAMAKKDLDEANRIKAAVDAPAPAAAAAAAESTPAGTAAAGGFSLPNTRWVRFGIGDHGECSLTFLPGGKLQATNTSWSNWKQDGDTLVLLKGDKVASRLTIRRNVTVFATDGALAAKDSLILVPHSYAKPTK